MQWIVWFAIASEQSGNLIQSRHRPTSSRGPNATLLNGDDGMTVNEMKEEIVRLKMTVQ